MAATSSRVPLEQHNRDRMRRASSWLKKSKTADNPHEKFIFLWIAFNAAYGADDIGMNDDGTRTLERDRFLRFLRSILIRDKEKEIQKIVGAPYSKPILTLLSNYYVYKPYWRFVRGHISMRTLKASANTYAGRVEKALNEENINTILAYVFFRLYTLRNQIFHGGTTFGASWGKVQLRDGSQIMESLVPVILRIMKKEIRKNPATRIWGPVVYPHINKSADEKIIDVFSANLNQNH